MSDFVIVALVAGTGSVLAASIPSYFAHRAVKAADATHRAVNSRLTELLKITRASSAAKARLQERQKQASVTNRKNKI